MVYGLWFMVEKIHLTMRQRRTSTLEVDKYILTFSILLKNNSKKINFKILDWEGEINAMAHPDL